MELKLDEAEVKDIIYDWANAKFPGYNFNTLKIAARYDSLQYIELGREEPDAEQGR